MTPGEIAGELREAAALIRQTNGRLEHHAPRVQRALMHAGVMVTARVAAGQLPAAAAPFVMDAVERWVSQLDESSTMPEPERNAANLALLAALVTGELAEVGS